MEQSTTDQVVDNSVADNSSTTEPTTNSADKSTQGTSVNTQPSDKSADNTNSTETEDQELAKFAKGQGINDLSELSDRERSLLKMARDNKSALDKAKQSAPKLDESSNSLSKLDSSATDVQKLAAKVANIEFKEKKESFFSDKDKNLESDMAKIVTDKQKEYGDDYARALLNDLPTLYTLAKSLKASDTKAIVEQAKEEERNSMNQSLSAGAVDAHARDQKPASKIVVTNEWIQNEYDPKNPEHRALVDAAIKSIK